MPNIVNLPNDIYSGGSTVLNPQPYVNYIIQQQQRQQAKKEAVDNYYRDLSKTLTPAGMAGNDVEDFTNKVNQWKDFVTQNRNVLNNPNDKNYAKTVNQEGYLYNDALAHSAQSKQKVADLSKANDIRLQHPDYDFTDAAIGSLHNASLPLSKGYQPLDQSTLGYNNKPANADDILKYQNIVKNGFDMSEGNPAISVDPKTKSKIVTTKSSYSPADLNSMSSRAEMLYKTDKKVHDFVNQMSQDPANYNELNGRFKSIYGHDLDIQHPEEFATALLLPQTEKINTQPYNFSPTNIKINLGDQAAPSLDNYISQLRANAQPRTYKYANGKTETHYEIQPSPQLSNLFTAKSGSSTIYPDQIQFLPNGDVLPIYYKNETKNGTTSPAINEKGHAAVDQTLSKPVSQSEFRIRLAKEMFGEKGLMNVMKTPSQSEGGLPKQTAPKAAEYSNITETNKGTLGYKNGKWYYTKTGKEYKE